MLRGVLNADVVEQESVGGGVGYALDEDDGAGLIGLKCVNGHGSKTLHGNRDAGPLGGDEVVREVGEMKFFGEAVCCIAQTDERQICGG